jgi:hypothetical protein
MSEQNSKNNLEENKNIFDDIKKTCIETYQYKTLLEFNKNNNIKYIEENDFDNDLYEILVNHEKEENTEDYQEYLKDDLFYYDNYSRGLPNENEKKIKEMVEDICIINDVGYHTLAQKCLLHIFSRYIKGLNYDYKYIIYKDDDNNIYIYHKKDINKDEIIDELNIIDNDNSFKKNNKYLNPVLQYKVNKIKNKIKDNKLKKDLKFKLNGKEYTFSSNYIDENIIKPKKKSKVYPLSNILNRNNYKRITDEDIKIQDEKIKNNELNNKEFWDNYYKDKNKNKDKIKSLFKDDPVIEFDKESFYEKYKDKHFTSIYKDVLYKLDELEKEFNNFKIIENNYNKLKENKTITNIFKNNKNKLNDIFNEYEENKINEYKVLKNLGELIVNNMLSKEEMKEINSLNENSRPARVIKQSKRIYILNKFVDIKNIALAGISNWLRDTSEDNFEILLSFFEKKEEYNIDNGLPGADYFSDDEPPIKNNVTRLVFT